MILVHKIKKVFEKPKYKIVKQRLMYSDYEITKSVPSIIDPMNTTTVVIGMGCPKCHIVMKAMSHFETRLHTCGLKLTLHGNALDCEMKVKI